MAMMVIIFGSVFLTGVIALIVSRKVENGEARFGPEGPLPPYQPPANDRSDMTVTLKQDSKTDD
jgi:hypothetical protein